MSLQPDVAGPVDFGEFVRRAGALVVQPRMGFGEPARMRAGLLATKQARATTAGTITIDSYTRVGELARAQRALHTDPGVAVELNGYPIVAHGPVATRQLVDGIAGVGFPVQVRHGSADPRAIVATAAAAGLYASEGGPVSYCLPYGRTSLAASVRNWAECADRLAALGAGPAVPPVAPHLETFGGCMLGQLCPPSQLVAISVLEAVFFHYHGVRSLSVSYAQQTNPVQDREAVLALRRLCTRLLPPRSWHVVVYAYMGAYPQTEDGAYRLLGEAAELAVATGSERLIVKTVAESRRIPTIEENVAALEYASRRAALADRPAVPAGPAEHADSQTYLEAAALVDAVLGLDDDPGRALLAAFARGYLDIPYCLHPDNAGRTRSYLDADGWLRWASTGSLPLDGLVPAGRARPVTSAGLLADLSYVRRTFDGPPHLRVRGALGV